MWLPMCSLWLHSSHDSTAVSNPSSAVTCSQIMGLPARGTACSVSGSVPAAQTDGNVQNPVLKEHTLLRSSAVCSFLLLVSHSHLFSSEILTQPDKTQWFLKFASDFPCSYNPNSNFYPLTLCDAVVSKESSQFPMHPWQRWTRPVPPRLLCRDWRSGKISYQKLKYRSTGMSGNRNCMWTQFWKVTSGPELRAGAVSKGISKNSLQVCFWAVI